MVFVYFILKTHHFVLLSLFKESKCVREKSTHSKAHCVFCIVLNTYSCFFTFPPTVKSWHAHKDMCAGGAFLLDTK